MKINFKRVKTNRKKKREMKIGIDEKDKQWLSLPVRGRSKEDKQHHGKWGKHKSKKGLMNPFFRIISLMKILLFAVLKILQNMYLKMQMHTHSWMR